MDTLVSIFNKAVGKNKFSNSLSTSIFFNYVIILRVIVINIMIFSQYFKEVVYILWKKELCSWLFFFLNFMTHNNIISLITHQYFI